MQRHFSCNESHQAQQARYLQCVCDSKPTPGTELAWINTCSERGVRKGQHQVPCGNFSRGLVKKRGTSTEV